VPIAVCAYCGGPVVTFASMCPHCGHRASSRGAVTIGSVPVFGSRRRGPLGRLARRLTTFVLVGAGVAVLFVLSHLLRASRSHQADDQEEQCRIVAGMGEEHPGELAECQSKLSQLRAIERDR
jgi:hypothetical protein